MKRLALPLSIVGAMFAPSSSAQAQDTGDASWGCQVLLCAASSAPSWQGVPYCVPPMTKLISAMSVPGFTWPSCSEAGTSAPGYEKYEACPEGSEPAYGPRRDNEGMGDKDVCERTVNKCTGVMPGSNSKDHSCIETIQEPRPRREDPYYFDIANDKGEKERFWFNLNY